ncbi:MAG TPA: glycosyltransferase family 4 protein [Mucilaginibacter sp.]|jgi:UDP-N-acetylmuramyl pentapeptide phosphotransferase/UDP-N-acetylglucosamine-1-phosphate transferase
MTYLFILISLLGVILIYFNVADHYNIIDHPNERSSHTEITIRGGGIAFLFASVAAFILHPQYWLPLSGVFIIGVISFLDDTVTLSVSIRLLFHLIAVTIMFLFVNIFKIEPFYVYLLLYILVIGIINMYNFMDGINGITGAYSIVIFGGLQYVNLYQVAFINPDMIWIPMMACAVFLYFNFRKKAKCFAGDVGSVSVAFWISMLLLKLILITGNWSYILFLAVYGVDSVLTIIHRLALKQNIFKAHRLHFYQLLANEQKIPHLVISTGYSILQLTIIILVIFNTKFSLAGLFFICIFPLISVYIVFKPKLMLLKGK